MKLARRFCPAGTIISGDYDASTKYSDMVTDIVREESPVFEKASIDEFYVDMTGMERFHGTFLWAETVRAKVTRETGLPISMGLAANKLVAKVATNEVKPGALEVPRGTEQPFLDPLSVHKIPMVGEKTAQFLSNMGVRQVRTLRDIPREFLQRILGKPGDSLWQRAHGIDDSPIEPYSERKSVSAERTFPEDTIDITGLRASLTRMTERLAFGLRSARKLSACITVKLRYADFNTVTRQARIAYTASDHLLINKALELFEQLYDRRQRVRLVGVRFSHLIHGGHQINLFEDTERQIHLYEAIDKVKHRFGADAVMRASALGGLDRHDPDAPEGHAHKSHREGPADGIDPRQYGPSARANPREMPLWLPKADYWEAAPDIQG